MSLLRKGAIVPRRALINYALSFDGQNDYVEFPADIFDSLYTLGTFSIACWIKLPIQISSDAVLIGIEGGVNDWALFFNGYERTIYASFTGDPIESLVSTVDVQTDIWHFFVVTYDGTLRIFIDGTLDNSSVITLKDITAIHRVTQIGHACIDGGYLKGIVDEVCIYNRALTLSEIQHNMYAKTPALDGLVLWLPMNEGRGDTVYDKSGYGNNGTIYGATWVRR